MLSDCRPGPSVVTKLLCNPTLYHYFHFHNSEISVKYIMCVFMVVVGHRGALFIIFFLLKLRAVRSNRRTSSRDRALLGHPSNDDVINKKDVTAIVFSFVRQTRSAFGPCVPATIRLLSVSKCKLHACACGTAWCASQRVIHV